MKMLWGAGIADYFTNRGSNLMKMIIHIMKNSAAFKGEISISAWDEDNPPIPEACS
jgi:hypothetical protein